MESTILREVSPEQIVSLFEGLQSQLTELKTNLQPKEPVELLTRAEVANMLKCDLGTIHNWCKRKKLIPYGIGNRIYFKKSDINNALVQINKKGGADE